MPFNSKRLPAAFVVASLLAVPAVALADNIHNDLEKTANDEVSISNGGSAKVGYRISATANDGQKGCNAADSTPATVTINRPAGVTVTGADLNSQGKLVFTSCDTDKYATFSSSTAGNHAITVSVADGGTGTYTTDKASFTLKVAAPTDTTAPVIAPHVTGTLGQNGWYTGNVNVSWTVSDDESTVSSSSGCGPTTISTDTAGVTLTCTATSAGGTDSRSVTIKRDATAPTNVATALNRGADHNGWYNAAVGWTTTGSDATSGIPADGCDTGTYSGLDGTGLTVSGGCTDRAGNRASDSSAAFKFDNTNPTLSPTVSPNPVLLNGSATANANASDATSLVASEGCDPVDTSAVGARSVTCRATDNAGNANSASANYSVVYAFTGFFQPIDNGGVFNRAKAGSTIPVKFSLGGDQGLSILASAPSSTQVACPSSTTTVDELEQYTTAVSGLKYDATANQYIYNWKTDGAWAGECRQLIVRLNDGTNARTANFIFTK